jgi:hypothetical protein
MVSAAQHVLLRYSQCLCTIVLESLRLQTLFALRLYPIGCTFIRMLQGRPRRKPTVALAPGHNPQGIIAADIIPQILRVTFTLDPEAETPPLESKTNPIACRRRTRSGRTPPRANAYLWLLTHRASLRSFA